MQIEKIFSESILQKLFENRHEEFSHKFTTLTDTKKMYDNLENRLKSLLGYINNEHYNYAESEIDGILSDMQVCIEYWNSGFYKLGVIDGMNLKKNYKKSWRKIFMETLMDSFMNSCGDSFIQYFEKHRFKNLVNREDYKSLHSKMQLIFDEFPKVRTFIEDRLITELNDDEKDAVLRILDINEKIVEIEAKEFFKLGFKEAYIFFEEQDLLNK